MSNAPIKRKTEPTNHFKMVPSNRYRRFSAESTSEFPMERICYPRGKYRNIQVVRLYLSTKKVLYKKRVYTLTLTEGGLKAKRENPEKKDTFFIPNFQIHDLVFCIGPIEVINNTAPSCCELMDKQQ